MQKPNALLAFTGLLGLGVDGRVIRSLRNSAEAIGLHAISTLLVLVEHVGETHERVSSCQLAEVAHLRNMTDALRRVEEIEMLS